MSKFIKIYQNALSKKVCEEIIQKYEDSPHKYRGVVKNPLGKATVRGNYKNNEEVVISRRNEWQDVHNILHTSLYNSFKKYKKDLPIKLGDFGYSGFYMKKYLNDGKEFYDWHVDGGSFATCRRFMTAIWYLNDVEEGGETEFKYYDKPCKPKQGNILFFPSEFMYEHKGNSPISNPKYIIVTFLVFRSPYESKS